MKSVDQNVFSVTSVISVVKKIRHQIAQAQTPPRTMHPKIQYLIRTALLLSLTAASVHAQWRPRCLDRQS